MMRPKGATANETGLLEYLEDIIGTDKYVEAIEAGAKRCAAYAQAFRFVQLILTSLGKQYKTRQLLPYSTISDRKIREEVPCLSSLCTDP